MPPFSRLSRDKGHSRRCRHSLAVTMIGPLLVRGLRGKYFECLQGPVELTVMFAG
jgi:hypothetical protein